MLEWNAFIKPVVYVLELVFAAVVTIGTADGLLFHDASIDRLRCAFNDSIGACSAVISLGALCMVGGFYVLWKRLSSAFLCDMKYRNDTETVMCMVLSIGWLSVASVITYYRPLPTDVDPKFLLIQRRVTITFAWLLWVFHIGSMAIAWFAPDEDGRDEPFHPDIDLRHAQMSLQGGLAYPFASEDATTAFDRATTIQPDTTSEVQASPDEVGLPNLANIPAATNSEMTDLSRFLSQHDALEDANAARAPGQSLRTPVVFAEEPLDTLRPQESIQDLASTWKDIVSADIEAETPEIEITMEPESHPEDSGGAPSSQLSGPSSRPTLRRRRTVRFDSSDTEL